MAVLLDAFQEAVGSVKAWLRANTAEPLPANWVICDGSTISDPDSAYNGKAIPDLRDQFLKGHPTLTNANFAADATYEAGGTIPAGGVATHNLTHAHPAGAHIHGVGAHNHSVPNSGTHGHTVGGHYHNLYAHGHSIDNDNHTHGGTGATSIFTPLTQGGGQALVGAVDPHSHTIPAYNHSHNGVTQGSNGPTFTHASAESVTPGGDHNHGGTTGPGLGSTDPGSGNTGDGLAVIDNTPQNLALLMILKIK